jgi:hypothetical protein
MAGLTSLQFEILNILLDNHGHANWELAIILDRDEGNLSKVLKSLLESNLICKGSRRDSTNSKTKGKRYSEDPYYIIKSLRVFSLMLGHIIEKSLEASIETFLSTNYINELIKKEDFLSIHEILKAKLDDEHIRDLALSALLNQPATIEAYKSIPKWVEDWLRGLDYGQMHINKTVRITDFDILRDCGIINGVQFYRKNLLNDFINLYKIRAIDNTNGKIMLKFVEYDNFLSPFTAYPVNEPIELIFDKFFNRIYEDVYIIESGDLDCLLKRADFIFENFCTFLNIYTKSSLQRNKEAIIKEFVVYWNLACSKFETIYNWLRNFHKFHPEWRYYLGSEGDNFQITELNTNQRLLNDVNREKLKPSYLNTGITEFDQTKFIRPPLLEIFAWNARAKLVPIEVIFAEFE